MSLLIWLIASIAAAMAAFVAALAVAAVAPSACFFGMGRQNRGWLAFGAGCLVIVVAAILSADMAHPARVFPAALFAGVLVGSLIFLLNAEQRAHMRRAARVSARVLAPLDFGAAQRAANQLGRRWRHGRLSIWTDVTTQRHAEFNAIFDETAEAFRTLTGLRPRTRRRLRVICFDRAGAFDAYSGFSNETHTGVLGYYLAWGADRIVLSRENSEIVPATLQHVLAHEYVHHLTKMALGRVPKPWLSEGLAEFVAWKAAPRVCGDPGSCWRFLRAAEARGDYFADAKFFAIWYPWLGRHSERDLELEMYRFVATFYVQSALVVRFLWEKDRNAFARYLAGYAHGADAGRHFERSFGFSHAQALQRFDAYRQGIVASSPAEPDEQAKRRIESELIAPLLDSERDLKARRWLVRRFDATGYAWRLDALIDLLDGANADLRSEAVFALESIAGQRCGDDSAAWRQWLRRLPASVTGVDASS